MIRSMTGYGRGEASRGGWKFTVELSSVNRKQGDVSVHLPREFIELEPRIRDVVNGRISRGRVTVVLGVHRGNGSMRRLVVDEDLVEQVYHTFRRIAKKLGIEEEIPLATVFSLPDVVHVEDLGIDVEPFWRPIRLALRRALDSLVAMREKEGQALQKDLTRRLNRLKRIVDSTRRHGAKVPARYREQLQARLQEAGLELNGDDERLHREIALFADRCDISEEITRLESHIDQFEQLLGAAEPVGRTLEFLAQEMNREINTIGSKANDVRISQQVVRFKAELERVREQVQNVE